MNKIQVLEQLNLATVAEAVTISLTEGNSGSRLGVVKSEDGEGITATEEEIINAYVALSKTDKNWVYNQFTDSYNLVSGRPCK